MHALRPRFHVLVNPASGRGRGRRAADELLRLARLAGLDPVRVDLEHAGHATRRARELEGEDADLVVVGGDGTFNEVLNGIHPSRHRLAFLPCGTVNVIAKQFGMVRRPDRWFEQMRSAREVVLDAGEVNGRRFFIVVGAGLDGQVIREVSRDRAPAFRFSHYFLPVARAALASRRFRVRIEAEGFDPDEPFQFVVIGNLAQYGGPCRFTVPARADDGLLDVCALRLPDLSTVVLSGLAALAGCVHRLRSVRYRRVARALLRSETDCYQFDGEPGGPLPAEVCVRPGAVRLLVPATPADGAT